MGKRTAGLTGLARWSSLLSTPAVPETTEPRPTKKRRIEAGAGLLRPRQPDLATVSQAQQEKDWIAYDATGLVPHYADAGEVPEHLQKYYAQRNRFFSLYAQEPGCLLDEEGWYSVTPERIADQIAERCRCDTILDAFCGVGGNAIAFAKTCERVIALDTSPTRLALARHNAHIYGVAHRIEFILTDYISFANSYLSLPKGRADARFGLPATDGSTYEAALAALPECDRKKHTKMLHERRKIDVVFLSPPWGGPAYLSGTKPALETPPAEPNVHPPYDLSSIRPIHGADLFTLTRKITKNVAYFLPRNTSLDEIAALVEAPGGFDGKQEKVEVEEEWMGTKLKALTCYYGGLADGQADLW